jgi:hypothetical protein
MDGRLLLLAALLACNALYLIWKAKGSPAIRLDGKSVAGSLELIISRLTGIFAPERNLKQIAIDKPRATQPLRFESFNHTSPGKEGSE